MVVALIALPMAGWAAECSLPTNLDAMSAAIRKAQSCVAAARLAEDCAFGASGDVSLQGAVIAVCERDFLPHFTGADARTYRHALKNCRRKYASKQGTMYLSAAAFCEGKAAQDRSAAVLKARRKSSP